LIAADGQVWVTSCLVGDTAAAASTVAAIAASIVPM